MSKKLSGSQFRKIREQTGKENIKLSHSMRNYLIDSSDSNVEVSSTFQEKVSEILSVSGSTVTLSLSQEDIIPDKNSEADFSESVGENKSVPLSLNYNDPTSWPRISDSVKRQIVCNGPDQGKDVHFKELPTNLSGRRFTEDWFIGKQKNGEKIERKWLIYCKNQNKIFCFPCMLFSDISTQSCLTNAREGFNDWKHLSTVLPRHENSLDHHASYCQWKILEKNIKDGSMIDDFLGTQFEKEKNKWREILRTIVDVILFCASNNLALRGSDKEVGKSQAGIFLNLIELVSHYNPTLKMHLENHTKGSVSYFSPTIQNEIIDLMGNKVSKLTKNKIIEAKYFSILFDCTPDVSHKEQMSQVIRYVHVEKNKVSVEESFIDFIESHEKTGQGLASEILEKLENDNLNVKNIRGQGYDNGANMSGKYQGVQSRILNINKYATYIPCKTHSLNLVGNAAASVNVEMVTFFSTLEKVYAFFSRSTSRWRNLMNDMKISLKRLSDTRWSARSNAVKAFCLNFSVIFKKLQEYSLDKNLETRVDVNGFLAQMNFEFILILLIWHKILQNIDRVNRALQSTEMTLDKSVVLLDSLCSTLQRIREVGFDSEVEKATEIANNLNIEAKFTEKRSRKRKRMSFDESQDDSVHLDSRQKFNIHINESLDKLLVEIKSRFDKTREIAGDFSFLYGETLKNTDVAELKKCAKKLADKYDQDLNEYDFLCEIESFKDQAPKLASEFFSYSPLNVLQLLHDYKLIESYPNIQIALRIFLTLPVTVASSERSFSKLKLIKTYLRSTMGQMRLTNLAKLSIEKETVKSIDFNDIIDEFSSVNAKRQKLF